MLKKNLALAAVLAGALADSLGMARTIAVVGALTARSGVLFALRFSERRIDSRSG